MPTTTKPRSPTFALILLDGEYHLARQKELWSQLSAAASLELALLDMHDVTFLDTAALAEFIRLRKRMASPAIVRIVSARSHIRRLFDITGLSKMFEFHDSFASAVVPLPSGAPAASMPAT